MSSTFYSSLFHTKVFSKLFSSRSLFGLISFFEVLKFFEPGNPVNFEWCQLRVTPYPDLSDYELKNNFLAVWWSHLNVLSDWWRHCNIPNVWWRHLDWLKTIWTQIRESRDSVIKGWSNNLSDKKRYIFQSCVEQWFSTMEE